MLAHFPTASQQRGGANPSRPPRGQGAHGLSPLPCAVSWGAHEQEAEIRTGSQAPRHGMCCLVGLCQMPILGKLFCSTSTRQLPGTAGLHLPALQGSTDPLTTQRLQLAFSASQPLCQTLTGATTHSFYFLILKAAQRAGGRQETNLNINKNEP